MRFPQETIKLKNGEFCVLRSPEPEEAAQRLAFAGMISDETDFMGRSGSESPSDVGLMMEIMEDQLDSPDSVEVAAFSGSDIVACGSVGPLDRSSARRKHRALLGVAVRRMHWGRGIGTALLRVLTEEAWRLGYEQLELCVSSENLRAIALYERAGFIRVGSMPRALKYGPERYADEIWMLLERPAGRRAP